MVISIPDVLRPEVAWGDKLPLVILNVVLFIILLKLITVTCDRIDYLIN